MMKRKVKIYRMPLSRTFPAKHPRKGELTSFKENLCVRKVHTIRTPYESWKKRIDEVNAGDAILVLYEWSGRPYHTSQVDLFIFGSNNPKIHRFIYEYYRPLPHVSVTLGDEIGVQKLFFAGGDLSFPRITKDGALLALGVSCIAENDGLSSPDFRAFFKYSNLSEPLAIIHFTNFRY
jgi:hypothetical protein